MLLYAFDDLNKCNMYRLGIHSVRYYDYFGRTTTCHINVSRKLQLSLNSDDEVTAKPALRRRLPFAGLFYERLTTKYNKSHL